MPPERSPIRQAAARDHYRRLDGREGDEKRAVLEGRPKSREETPKEGYVIARSLADAALQN